MTPTQDDIKQTPINNVHKVDVLNFMRGQYSGVVEVGSSSGALSRVFHQPPEALLECIRQIARAAGNDPEQAAADAIPFQYVLRAVATAP